MATDYIPEIDEIFERARRRFNEGMAEVRRDLTVLAGVLRRTEDPHEIVEAVESDRLLRKLPDNADVM